MKKSYFLGFDIGGTKIAWGVFSEEGALQKSGKTATPQNRDALLSILTKVIKTYPVKGVGIGIAGTVSADHEDIIVSPNIPSLSHFELGHYLETTCKTVVAIDNDARCALLGEVWRGVAKDYSNAILLTIGTGLGGAVLQRGAILPHPEDVSQEIGRILVDPLDAFPASSGRGTVEAFLGGSNLEQRLGIKLSEIAKGAREGDLKAKRVWKQISYYFLQSMRAVHDHFHCEAIIIGGIGSRDLAYYLQDEPPCPIVAAKLGGKAGMYGAAQLAIALCEQRRLEAELVAATSTD